MCTFQPLIAVKSILLHLNILLRPYEVNWCFIRFVHSFILHLICIVKRLLLETYTNLCQYFGWPVCLSSINQIIQGRLDRKMMRIESDV